NYQLQRFPAAEAAYLKVIRDYPRSDLVPDALFGAGMTALRQGKADAARQQLRQLVDRYPRSEDRPQAMLRDPLFRQGELHAAAEDGLIQALLELQEYGAAIPRLEGAVARLPATDP